MVQEKYGPTASVVNVSSKNRHERFGVMFVEVSGLDKSQKLACFGHGDSYEAAIKMADSNELAQKYAKEWEQTKKDFETFRNDPHGYLEAKKAEMQKIGETNNG